MFVKDRLEAKSKELFTISPKANIVEAMDMMIKNQIGCLPVVGSSGQLMGIVSDQDIFSAVHKSQDDYKKYSVKELMTEDLIIGVPDDDINYIAGLMTKNDIRHVPIMEKDKLIGMISAGDVVKSQMKHIQIENRYLKMYMEGTHMG